MPSHIFEVADNSGQYHSSICAHVSLKLMRSGNLRDFAELYEDHLNRGRRNEIFCRPRGASEVC